MIITKQNAEHYTWGENCDGWHLLKSDSLSVIQERMPSGTSEVLHYHVKAQQVFFILSGTAIIEIEGIGYKLKSLESITIKNGLKHKITNDSLEDLQFLVISEPKAQGDRVTI